MSRKKRCTKGKSCGSTCISMTKLCIKEGEGSLSKSLSKITELIGERGGKGLSASKTGSKYGLPTGKDAERLAKATQRAVKEMLKEWADKYESRWGRKPSPYQIKQRAERIWGSIDKGSNKVVSEERIKKHLKDVDKDEERMASLANRLAPKSSSKSPPVM